MVKNSEGCGRDVGEAGRSGSGSGVGGRCGSIDEAPGSECSEQGHDWYADPSAGADTGTGRTTGTAADNTGGSTGQDGGGPTPAHHHPSGTDAFGKIVWCLARLNLTFLIFESFLFVSK